MDSRLLAGAYSKRYKYIERDQIEALKDDPEKTDVLAKARKLSQETNRRRKQQAHKRKVEAAREEKRRQEILNRRHQEQKQATEKYQRYNVPTRPPQHHRYSPRRHGQSQTHVGGLEEALRMVRGSSTRSSGAIQRLYSLQQTNRDPMERSYIKSAPATHGGHAGQGDTHQGHVRPQSGTQRAGDPSVSAMLSLRNLTNSRSRFEQQLEHHQQLLVEQQQKSLHEFNEAIRREIDTDAKVQGTEDEPGENMSSRSESLSSLDSLEEGNETPLSGSLPENQAQVEFAAAGTQHNERLFEKTGGRQLIGQEENMQMQHQSSDRAAYSISTGGQSMQDHSVRGQQGMHTASGKGGHGEPVTNIRGTSHIIGPIPQGYNSPKGDAQPSSTPVIQGSYYQDSLDMHQPVAEKRVTVGTALRLPQQPVSSQNQVIKQPAPALQYNSQLLAHRQFEPRPNYVTPSSPSKTVTTGPVDGGGRGMNPSTNNNSVTNHGVLNSEADHNVSERPKAHVYAWTSPSPAEQEQIHGTTGLARGMTDVPSESVPPTFATDMAADRVMATKVNPHSSRSMATSATTTCVYQTVNSAFTNSREPIYSQPGTNMSSVHTNGGNMQEVSHGGKGVQMQEPVPFLAAQQPNHSGQTEIPRGQGKTEIPRGQGQKPGSVLQTMISHQQTIDRTATAGEVPQYADSSSYQNYRRTDKQVRTPQGSAGREGTISKGTLGLLNGRLTVMDTTDGRSTTEKKVVIVENTVDKKAVRGILKRVPDERQPIKGLSGTQTKFNVHDSLEIAKKHRQQSDEAKRKKVPKKKAVRFADLHYDEEDIEDDTDSLDSMTEAALANDGRGNTQHDRKPEQGMSATQPSGMRARPASARVASATPKATEAKSKAPRVASAGPTRHTPAARPKAAAHIIMSGENHGHINNHNHNHNHNGEASTASITAHKSQLEKKVSYINNNFMSRVPVYTGVASTASSAAATNNMPVNTTAAVYTATQGRPASSTYSVPSNGPGSVATRDGFSKTLPSGADNSKFTNGKSMVTPSAYNSAVLPSHSHFSGANNNNSYKPVYNENGMRIDRTPTDDEINNLWMNMRTILEMGGDKGAPSTSSAGAAAMSSNINNMDHQPGTRQMVHLSSKIIDGAALGTANGMTRVRTASASQLQAGQQKVASQQKNGYLQRYSLLQQRRNPGAGIGSTPHTTNVVEQTLHPMPTPSNGYDPRHAVVNTSMYAPREEVTESMAGFLAAEQMVQAHGNGVSDSRVMAAMESAQQQQEAYNSIRQKYAKGGAAALSVEEHKLLESLDRLNERLNNVENRMPTTQPSSYSAVPANHQVYVHTGGFRGHQIITSQRRSSARLRPTQSARLLNRHHY